MKSGFNVFAMGALEELMNMGILLIPYIVGYMGAKNGDINFFLTLFSFIITLLLCDLRSYLKNKEKKKW